MKRFLSIAVLFAVNQALAQQQTFDLITYTQPKGWKKEIKDNIITLTKIDQAKNTWCVIGIVKSTISKGSMEADLQSEWHDLVVQQYNVDSMHTSETHQEDGWNIQAAAGKFFSNNQRCAVLLTTFSGYDRCVSILATTNSERYLNFIEDFIGKTNIKKPATDPVTNTQAPATNNGYTYTTTTFDDGWNASEEADWVKVSKNNITILLHYAKEATVIAADPDVHISNAWNILVAPRYKNLVNYKIASPSLDYQRAYLGTGNATDIATGKQVYVALFRKGNSNWLECIAPDKNAFVKAFNIDVDQIGWDAPGNVWEPLLKMFQYNKFAVSAADIIGKWSSWSGSNVQYVYATTGLDAGMGHAQSGNEIIFHKNGTYNREYKGVSGSPGGGNKYYGEKNNGNAIVSNWEIQLTNAFKGETHVFSAGFEAVKGGRILHLYRQQIEEMHLYKTK